MIVKCYDGTHAERKEVRRIKGEYYRHSDFLMIEGVRYRCTNARVTRVVDTGKLIETRAISRSLLKSVKLIKSRTGEILFERLQGGSYMDFPNKLFYSDGNMNSSYTDAASIALLKGNPILKENTSTGVYWIQEATASKDLIQHFEELAKEYEGYMYERLQYSMHRNEKFFEGHTYKPKANLGLDALIAPYTFGAEFETSSGKIDHGQLLKLGVAPLRDGSISGYEYTTIPLNSINHLKDIVDTLNDKCKITYKDSLHFHIGNVPRSKTFLLKLFKLSEKLQDEFYSMVPSYKLRDEHHIKRREQNYTNKLPVIDITKDNAINYVVKFLSDGNESNDRITMRPHPSDPSGDHKWQIRNRYTCINFVNYIYGSTGTIEFRLHQGTVNAYKAIYWLLINAALVKYVGKYTSHEIQNNTITITDVLSDVYGTDERVFNALKAYVDDAKAYFGSYDPDDHHFKKDSNADKAWEPRLKLW